MCNTTRPYAQAAGDLGFGTPRGEAISEAYSHEIFGPEGGPTKHPYYCSLGAHYGDQVWVLLNWVKEDSQGKDKVEKEVDKAGRKVGVET